MPQSLHPDFETTLPDTDYFFLGSGSIQAAIQHSRHPGATPLGIIISDPEHFARKWSTHLFHPEYGLEKTMATVILDGVRYKPDENVKIAWYPEPLPNVAAVWYAGDVYVLERFWTSFDHPVLVREISIMGDRQFDTVEIEISLYGNPALFSEFVGNHYGLGAKGYTDMLVSSHAPGAFHERTLTVPCYQEENSIYHGIFMYSLGPDMPSAGIPTLSANETEYWQTACARWTAPHPSPIHQEIERIFTASANGLRAAVSQTGRFDASIWQYGYEWSGDASLVCEALVYSGQFEAAQSVLENILTRMTIDEGMAMESSRFRGGQDSELNNNGEILKACHTYLDWTGDLEFIREYYPRIAAIANYLLRPEFIIEETGMLCASRDIWERSAAVGILPGYDVAHQTFGILGLRDAARIALTLGHDEDNERWKAASNRMKESFFNHPTHSMIEDGRIIKRRLLDGSVQTGLSTKTGSADFLRNFVPDGMPLAQSGERAWEPDISECFPICYGLIDPRSDIAKNTLESLDTLWSQAWDYGGYGRYNVLSEPDSPGPWPFATMFMAEALLASGDIEKAQRAINWLIESAGEGGNWFEFIGDRPTPPLPPTGIIVWGWAQWITLVVRHLIYANIRYDKLVIAPRMGGFSGEMRFRDTSIPIPEIR